ncbi:MAG: apolipoprotein N-acyltransferase [Labilithrix sp.]|nr:apolipoprotein N-acyltransferase [Labilithrix sp.]MCW5816110.1 apolipoprotein N-acyltransferase [Labilithrix sp.]
MATARAPVISLLLRAAASAILLYSTLPPASFWPASFFCLAPVASVAKQSVARAAIAGLAFGFFVHLLGFWWTVPAVVRVAHASPIVSGVAFGVYCALSALRCAFALGAAARCVALGSSLVVALPLSWMSAEMLFPQLLPWYLGVVVQACPVFMQPAALGGPVLVSGLVATVNAGVVVVLASWWSGKHREAWVRAAVLASAVASFALGGLVRMRALRERIARSPTSEVLVVQGNLGPLDARDREIDVHRTPTDTALRTGVRPAFVVWPETAITRALPADDTRTTEAFFRDDVLGALKRDEVAIDVPLLTGAILERRSARGPEVFNAAVMVAPDGRRLGTYLKQSLAPLGERALLGGAVPPVAPFTEGPRPDAIVLDEHRIGVSICFEDILYDAFARSVDATRPELLVNLTSDAWFGDSPGAELHLALARSRAVEHGRQLLRVTNDGVSALVEPTGEVTTRLPPHQALAARVRVRWTVDETWFRTVGDGLGWSALAIAARLLWGPLRPRARVRSRRSGRAR